MTLFKKGNYICLVFKDMNESKEYFIERGNFIVSQTPNNDNEYNNAVLFSKIHINVKYLSCNYDNNIMIQLKKKQTKLLI